MAKLRMLKIGVYGLQSDRKRVLEKMQRLGVVEIEDIKAQGDEIKLNTSQQMESFSKTIEVFEKTIEILDRYSEYKPKMLASYRSRPIMSNDEFMSVVERSDRNLERCYGILRKEKQIEELKTDILRLELRREALRPWQKLDVSMKMMGTKSTKTFIGTVPGVQTSQSVKALLAQKNPNLELFEAETAGQLADSTCVFIVAHESIAQEMEDALRAIGFARPPEISSGTPTESMDALSERIEAAQRQIEENEEGIRHYAYRRELFAQMLDYYTVRKEKYEMLGRLSCTKHAFILEGWVPQRAYERLKSELEPLGAYIEEIEQTKKDTAPTAIKNGAITEGGETVVQLYSMPSKKDIDPTPILAIFYYMLFGLMLGDACYGLIMVLACGGVLLFLKPEGSARRNMKLFMFSGLCSIFWGVIFGSYFGDLPNVIAKTFFGATENVVNPLWFDPIKDPVSMLLFSVALGILHVFTGLFLGLITNLKNKDIIGALGNCVSWLLLLGGGITYALNMLLGIFGRQDIITVPPLAQKIGVWCVIAGVIMILLLSDRSKSPVKTLLKGAYNLYGATSYLSDFLSYSRILALALATGVISQVFNTIGSMFGGGVMGAIVMVIVCTIGHILNILISLIGCYVHTCRLQYVEFFGKFYEGGGREFRPFSAKTKTFKFEEEKEL